MAYAAGTTVSVEKSMSEIMALLRKAGAQRLAQAEEPEAYSIHFFLHDRMIRFRVRIPTPDDFTRRGARPASNAERIKSAEQAAKQRARALLLVIKAKLESVESEVETFEEAFLANVVMADGMTVYERVSQPIALEYATGRPAMMLEGPRNG